MNLLVFAPHHLSDLLPYTEFDCVYVLDTGDLDCEEVASEASVVIITDDSSDVSEELLGSITDIVEVQDPYQFMASRGIPGDMAIIDWDASDESYEILELLCSAGVTVLDGSDDMIQISLDLDVTIESIIETITRRVTADVLRQVRAELKQDTPRRGRFRSSDHRA